jgi:hypothetical protein
MKYIKCYNCYKEVYFINVDNIVSIENNLDDSFVIVTVNNMTLYANKEALKNLIEFEKISEII